MDFDCTNSYWVESRFEGRIRFENYKCLDLALYAQQYYEYCENKIARVLISVFDEEDNCPI